ncbi:molybdopterin-guanine dinucleotide biosynthesis protein MobA [compost metagenome]
MMDSLAESSPDTLSNHIGGGLQFNAAVPVSVSGRVQPLLGLFHKRVLPALEDALSRERFRVMECLDNLDVLYVPEAGFADRLSRPSPLYNMNLPEDYAAAVKLVSTPADDFSV